MTFRSAYAFFIIAVFVILVVFPSAYAVPTTVAAGDVNSSSLEFRCAGASGDSWIQYGTVTGNYPWRTENTTPDGGFVTLVEMGLPLMSNTKFYYRCCDASGCGGELSSTLLTVTPNPATTYGRTAQNITESHLDPAVIAGSVIEPYRWVPGGVKPEIIIGILLFFVFTGLWLRQREVILPILAGLIGSGMLFYVGTNSVGTPPEFLLIAAVMVSLGLTGVVLGLFKR